jgi:hypothetical protein
VGGRRVGDRASGVGRRKPETAQGDDGVGGEIGAMGSVRRVPSVWVSGARSLVTSPWPYGDPSAWVKVT